MVSKRLRQNELLILSAYVEPLASGRRVVVLGEDAAALGERLVELGARAVHAYVSGPSPEPRTAPGVVIKRLIAQDDLDVRDGSFDVAIVADAGTLSDPEAALLRARRLVGPSGVVIVGAPAEGALGYYELFDLVSLHFAEIAMVGQVPFTGAALAVLGDDAEPEVTVDTQLAGDASPPTYFLAIASQSPLDVRPYVILQLPAGELDGRADEEEPTELDVDDDEAPTRRLRDLISERDLLTLRSLAAEREAANATAAAKAATELERERERQQQQRDRERQLERERDGQRDRATLSEARLRAEALEAQLQDHRARLQALEQELARRDEQSRILVQTAQAAEQAADALRARLQDATENIVTRDEHLARVLERTADLEQFAVRALELETVVAQHRDLEAHAVHVQQASMAAEALEAELIVLAEGHAAEVDVLEEALRDRGRTIHALERELARRARMIQELLIELDQRGRESTASATASATATTAGYDAVEVERLANDAARLRSALEALASDAARREGELQAMRWRIQELELQSASAAASVPPSSIVPARNAGREDEGSIERMRDELEMLRQALRQEHDARLRAEAGEELTLARAEIQRQAVLLEQLRTERGGVEDASATG